MNAPLQIAFHEMDYSNAIAGTIRSKAEKMERVFPRIISMRVVVEKSQHRHQQGNLYHVSIDISVPDGEVIVNRDPAERQANEDVQIAVHDAFRAAQRKLEDFAEKHYRNGRTSPQKKAQTGRVIKIFPELGYGFIEGLSGREIYFHKNSVLHEKFKELQVGDKVRYAEEQGDNGPQASTVRI